jgi:quercetin dioxygenase-like cupin family protein
MTDPTNMAELADIEQIPVWEAIRARRVEGERITLAIVELDPGAVAPEHTHPSEQLGIVLAGELRFRVGDEERLLRPGGTWRILGSVPHSAVAGPQGAVVIDVFSPPREDWHALTPLGLSAPRWPTEAT